MKLMSLRMEQWRSFEHCELEFPDGLIGVRGVNGAGKTTVAEAIGWALFGKLRAGAKVGDMRRQGAPKGASSLVELTFRIDDVAYRVQRVVGASAKLWIGDGNEPETTQTRATTARIVAELDMNWETFQRTVFARQKDIAALDPSGSSESRRRHVERLLGLERFRAAAEKARARAKELSAELRGLQEQAPDLTALRRELAGAEAAAAEDDPGVRVATAALNASLARVERLDGLMEEERGRQSTHERLVTEDGRLAVEIERIERDLDLPRSRAAGRAAKLARLKELNGGGADVATLAHVRHLWDVLHQRAEDLRRLESEAPAVSVDAEAAATRAERLAAEHAELATLRETPTLDLAELDARLEKLRAATDAPSREEARRRLEEVEGLRDRAREERATLRGAQNRDAAHMEAVETQGPDTECPVCLRPYGDQLDDILAEHRRRLEADRAELQRLEGACERLEEQRVAASAVHVLAGHAWEAVERTPGAEDIDEAVRILEMSRDAQRQRTARVNELEPRRVDLEAAVAVDTDAARLTDEHQVRLAEPQVRMAEALSALTVDQFDPDAHEAAVTAHEDALARLREQQELGAALEATTGSDAEVRELEERQVAARTRRSEIAVELEALAFSAERLSSLGAELEGARSQQGVQSQAVYEAKLAAQSRDHEVSDLRRRAAEAEETHKVMGTRGADVRRHDVAGQLLTDFRTEQNRRAWPKLEEGASALLSETTGGRYADVRLSEDYRLVIVDRGEEHGLERYSGGEQDLANLCLRLAIADWVARERGVEMGFVVLDEVFGSQDEERRGRLMDELRTLSNRFHQLMVITHVPEIAELCEHQLEVTLAEPGRSEAAFVA